MHDDDYLREKARAALRTWLARQFKLLAKVRADQAAQLRRCAAR